MKENKQGVTFHGSDFDFDCDYANYEIDVWFGIDDTAICIGQDDDCEERQRVCLTIESLKEILDKVEKKT